MPWAQGEGSGQDRIFSPTLTLCGKIVRNPPVLRRPLLTLDSRTRLAETALLLLPRVGQPSEGRQGGRSARTVTHQKDVWRGECRE